MSLASSDSDKQQYSLDFLEASLTNISLEQLSPSEIFKDINQERQQYRSEPPSPETQQPKMHDRMPSKSFQKSELEGSTGLPKLDPERVEQFGSRMLSLLNNGALTLMISIGHKTGLFETLAALPPVTSSELAKSAGLHERYVREWLSAMYVGGIVSATDSPDGKFYLPAENAAFLTWGRGPENVAVLSQYISILSSFEAKTAECFRSGGGIPVSEFGELKAIMAADAAQTIASSLVDWILPLGDGMLLADLRAGIDVLDVECGSGINLITLAKAFRLSWFTGYDSNQAHIAVARHAAEKEGLHNVRFKCMQVTESSEYAAYDVVTCFGGLVETGDVKNVVARIFEVLRRGGTFLLQDVAASSDARSNRKHPAGPLLYTISVMFSIPATMFKTGKEEEAVGVMWGNDRALELVRKVGFKCDGVKQLPDDHCNVFFFCQRE